MVSSVKGLLLFPTALFVMPGSIDILLNIHTLTVILRSTRLDSSGS